MPRQLLNKPTHKVDIGVTYENKGWTASLWGDYYIRMLDANSIANNGNYMESSETGTHYFFADSDKIEYPNLCLKSTRISRILLKGTGSSVPSLT